MLSPAYALTEDAKITASDGAGGDSFGDTSSVSICMTVLFQLLPERMDRLKAWQTRLKRVSGIMEITI